jgi:hypothetical protein
MELTGQKEEEALNFLCGPSDASALARQLEEHWL